MIGEGVSRRKAILGGGGGAIIGSPEPIGAFKTDKKKEGSERSERRRTRS